MDLKYLRCRQGLRIEEVAVAMGKCYQAIRFWEDGRSKPTLSPGDMIRLLQLYDCSLEALDKAVQASRLNRTNNKRPGCGECLVKKSRGLT